MPKVVSPTLSQSVTHTQVSAVAHEEEPIEFSLASDEAVEILAVRLAVTMAFPVGTADSGTHLLVSLDPTPNIVNAAAAGFFENNPESADIIADFKFMNDVVTSGIAQGDYSKMITVPPGIVTAQNSTAIFRTGNVGAQNAVQVFYRVLRLDDSEIVSLVARRRG